MRVQTLFVVYVVCVSDVVGHNTTLDERESTLGSHSQCKSHVKQEERACLILMFSKIASKSRVDHCLSVSVCP